MKQKNILIFLIISTLTLSACGKPEVEEETEEKAPPNVIKLSESASQSVGFKTALVENRNVGSQINTTGEIKANENNIFHINSFVSGRVLKDNVTLGQSIRQGQTLAVVQNLDVAKVQAGYIHELHQNEINIEKAKTQYTLAQKNLDREKRLLAEGISPRRDYQQAEADAAIAKTELQGQREHKVHINAEGKALMGAYGMSPNKVHSETIRTGSPIAATRSGIITKKNITLGDMVTADTVMYEITDLSQLWLDIAIYPKDVAAVRVGQSIRFSTDSLPGKTFGGRVDYVQPVATETSQTYIARAYLDNGQNILKPGMFGQVSIEQDRTIGKPFVPESAVQKYGRETFVFIPLKGNRFRKRTIVLGNKVPGGYLVEQGLETSETIVTKGSFTLKAELLKSQFAEEE